MTTTTHPNHPTQVRLPGQAAAHEGPVDMVLMYVMHHAFRRDLRRFAEAARRTPLEDRDTWRRLADRWELFSTVLHNHHSGEDAGLWPWLREHAAPEDVATLDAMEAEHEEIDPLLEGCAAGFARLAEAADEGARAALVVRTAAARDSLARHLEHEETDAILLVQTLMSVEEWHRVEKEHFQERLPIRTVLRVVPWVVDGLPADVRDRAFAEIGGPFRLLWVVGRRRYARNERLAFQHV